jgi:hypothetical protein
MPLDTLINNRTRRSNGLLRLLNRATEFGHEHNWEGAFSGTTGAAKDCTIRVKAALGFHGDVLEGAGRFVDFPPVDADNTFEVSGTVGPALVYFELWFTAAVVARVPFVASGSLHSGGRELTGDWTVVCFDSDACGIDGGGGTFHLKRID